MDPTTSLTGIREGLNSLAQEPAVASLAEEFAALDDWLGHGGFLPEQWAAAGVGRHRGDRPVLENVRHGTRRGYNEGCGCNACTMANRRRRNLTLAELEQMS